MMKIGMIGLGDIAQKAYLPIITQLADVEPIFCTRSSDALQALSEQYRVGQTCYDYRDLPRLGVDAVMIHAATSVHKQIASYFLQLGIPTFVDKPLADNAADVMELYDIASKHNAPLYVGFNRRHIPLYNHYLPEVANGQCGALTSLRWEKHRHNLSGEVRTFVFDDFIHPLDSVNLDCRADINDAYVTQQWVGEQLGRLDIQWQAGETLLHASMNRQFGVTTERVSATYQNKALQFDSFVAGRQWEEGQEVALALKDWTPMLTTKGFEAMIQDWLSVIKAGQLASHIVERNIATHQLAEALVTRLNTSKR